MTIERRFQVSNKTGSQTQLKASTAIHSLR